MKNMLFIIPPNMIYDRFVNPGFNERVTVKKSGKYGSPITDMPLGILSMSAYLKKHSDVKTKLIDFNIILNKLDSFEYKSFSDLFRGILSGKEWINYSPSIIGISALFTPTYRNMMDLADIARQIFPEAIIIAGGGVPTNLYRRIFEENTSFDALCYGEGEKPLLGLVKSDDKIKYLEESLSWITREKVKKVVVFSHDFIEDLNEIPFYDYSILDPEVYGLSPTLTNYANFENNKHTLFHYMTSRGCPYRCCFCASNTVHGRKMRYHSINRVRDDFVRLKSEFNANIINFQDDHLMASKERVHEIINIAKEIGLQLYFQNGITISSLDRKMLEAMKTAGVTDLVLPIESGSNRVLRDIMHKPLDLSIVQKVVNDCRQLGIDTDANILIGLPGETKQDIEDTRIFLRSLDANWFRIVVATPLVGSEMYEICIKNNYLSDDGIGCDYKKAVVNTDDFTAEYIEKTAYLLNLEINFVGNSDFRLGNYKKALERFENTIKVKDDHAFAYYFTAKCCKILGLDDKYQLYKKKYQELLEASMFWQNCVAHFSIPPLS
jgi:radical SAM superfamily enzyme YgiQ (UPF0313 family)